MLVAVVIVRIACYAGGFFGLQAVFYAYYFVNRAPGSHR